MGGKVEEESMVRCSGVNVTVNVVMGRERKGGGSMRLVA